MFCTVVSPAACIRHPVTHELLLPEQLLARLRKVDGHDGHLPSGFAPVNPGAQRPADDLMPEAHADDADSLLLQELLDKIHKLDNPRIVIESVLLYAGPSEQPRMAVTRGQLTGSRDEDGIDLLRAGIVLLSLNVPFGQLEAFLRRDHVGLS